MENASKALIMAAGVLIGVLILSLAVVLFTNFGATSQGVYTQMEERQLTQYNAQFTVYSGRTDITIYDIISVANLAKENNETYKDYTNYESEYKKIVAYIYQILNEDEGDAINTLTAYSELDRLKHLLMLKYQEKGDKKLLEKYMLKLEILEMEINKLMYNLYQNREVSTERGTSR